MRNIVEDELNVSLNDKKRRRSTIDGKKIFYKLVKTYTKISLVKIGALTNNDHSNVLHHLKKANDLYDTDKEFKDKYDRCFLRFSHEKHKYNGVN